MSKRYKVTRETASGERSVWSVGYPLLTSARSAARRLNQNSATERFRGEEMAPEDYALLADLEERQSHE